MLGVAFSPFQFVKATNSIDDWQSTDHAKRLKIVIDSTALAGDVNNSIVIFKFVDANFSGGVNDEGNDLKFYALDPEGSTYGTTPTACDYDPFDWNATAGGNIAVEVPMLDSGADATVYCYYDGASSLDLDNPSATYSNGKAIYHFEETSGTVYDTMGTSVNNMTNSGADSLSSAKIGKGYSFVSSSGDYMYAGADGVEFSDGSFTLISWIKPNTTKGCIFSKGDHSGAGDGYNTGAMWIGAVTSSRPTGSASYAQSSQTYVTGDTTLIVNGTTWYLISVVCNISDDTLKTYYNTTMDKSVSFTGTPYNNGGNAYFGKDSYSSSANSFNGYVDEFWVFTEAKTVHFIEALYKSVENSTTNFYIYTDEANPTFAFASNTPNGATFSTEVDGNVTISNATGWSEIESVNVSYSDDAGSTYTVIDSSVVSGDACVSSWDGDAYIRLNINSSAWTPDTDYKLKYICYDGVSYFTVTSDEFTIESGNTEPNKPTITRIGLVDVNASTAYDEDTGDNGFSLTFKGYNSSDPDGDDQNFSWTVDDVFSELFTTPDYNTTYSNTLNVSFTDDIREGSWYFGVTTTMQ